MRTALCLVLVAACGGSSPPPERPAPPPPAPTTTTTTTEDPVLLASALAEQYELGKGVYTAKKCDTCHEANGAGNPKNPPVIGPAAYPAQAPAIAKLRKGVTFTTAEDVVAFVKASMPIDNKGSLTDAEAYAVTSWMLSESKVELVRPLDAASAATVALRR